MTVHMLSSCHSCPSFAGCGTDKPRGFLLVSSVIKTHLSLEKEVQVSRFNPVYVWVLQCLIALIFTVLNLFRHRRDCRHEPSLKSKPVTSLSEVFPNSRKSWSLITQKKKQTIWKVCRLRKRFINSPDVLGNLCFYFCIMYTRVQDKKTKKKGRRVRFAPYVINKLD